MSAGPTPPPPQGPPAPTLRPGDIVADKYRVERVLGRGGMGVVVAATHIGLEQRIAIKFLLPEAAAQPELVTRFSREAKAAAKVRSDHGVKILDVGALPSGLPYMVMEYLEGEDLRQHLQRMGPLPPDVAAGFILQACEGLAEAHMLGIIHRDLKPANLFLARHANGEPLIKVLDFGISKAAHSPADVQLTRDATLMGSPDYISPEQLTSARSVDARSDIWSLGVVLYELLTGVKPFQSQTMAQYLLVILQKLHRPVRELRPDVPPALSAVIDRCLQKAPADRFQNVGELAQALAPFGSPRSERSVTNIARVLAAGPQTLTRSSAPPPGPPTPGPLPQLTRPAPYEGPGANPALAATARAERSSDTSAATGIIVAVLALFLLGGAGALLWLRKSSHEPATPAPEPSAETSAPASPSPTEDAAAPSAPAPSGAASSPPAPAPSTAPRTSAAPAPEPSPPAPAPADIAPLPPAHSGRHQIPVTGPPTHLRRASPSDPR